MHTGCRSSSVFNLVPGGSRSAVVTTCAEARHIGGGHGGGGWNASDTRHGSNTHASYKWDTSRGDNRYREKRSI